MAHLLEDCGEVVDDIAPEVPGEVPPDVAWLDGHVSSLSPASATNSWMASRESLVATSGRTGRRLVAGIGIINCMRSR
jgi:hypothetical protein